MMFKLALFLLLLLPGPRMTVLEEEQRDGYVCRLVEYRTAPRERVQAYLLVPDGASRRAKTPGLVLLHDHGARFDIGKEKLVRPLPSAPEHIRLSSDQWAEANFDGARFGDSLARCGFTVIVPDMLYWGSRSSAECREWSRLTFLEPQRKERIRELKTKVYEGQRAVFDSLASKGVVWAEQTLREDTRAVRVLSRLPYVNSRRIGAFGWSMGAHRCWLLAARCRQVKTGVALCWMTLKQTCAQPPTASDYSMMIPSLREKYDFPDIALELAPKPFFFLSGAQDRLFPKWAVDSAFTRMHAIYDASSASEALRTEFFDGPHHCGATVQQTITDYLTANL